MVSIPASSFPSVINTEPRSLALRGGMNGTPTMSNMPRAAVFGQQTYTDSENKNLDDTNTPDNVNLYIYRDSTAINDDNDLYPGQWVMVQRQNFNGATRTKALPAMQRYLFNLRDLPEFQTHEGFRAHWNFYGTVANNADSNMETFRRQQTSVAISRGKEVRMFNYWAVAESGAGLSKGATVGFILRRYSVCDEQGPYFSETTVEERNMLMARIREIEGLGADDKSVELETPTDAPEWARVPRPRSSVAASSSGFVVSESNPTKLPWVTGSQDQFRGGAERHFAKFAEKARRAMTLAEVARVAEQAKTDYDAIRSVLELPAKVEALAKEYTATRLDIERTKADLEKASRLPDSVPLKEVDGGGAAEASPAAPAASPAAGPVPEAAAPRDLTSKETEALTVLFAEYSNLVDDIEKANEEEKDSAKRAVAIKTAVDSLLKVRDNVAKVPASGSQPTLLRSIISAIAENTPVQPTRGARYNAFKTYVPTHVPAGMTSAETGARVQRSLIQAEQQHSSSAFKRGTDFVREGIRKKHIRKVLKQHSLHYWAIIPWASLTDPFPDISLYSRPEEGWVGCAWVAGIIKDVHNKSPAHVEAMKNCLNPKNGAPDFMKNARALPQVTILAQPHAL